MASPSHLDGGDPGTGMTGLALNAPEWGRLQGGYRLPYDPRPTLRRLELGSDVDGAWAELWDDLHHQGDVGEASYAAVPHLVRIHAARGIADWNTYALAATIDMARRDGRNPALPEHLRQDYEAAWSQLVTLGLHELAGADDPTLVAAILSVLALGKERPVLARLALEFNEDELTDVLKDAGW